MLKFNLKRIFRLRGIENPYNFLVKKGLSRTFAYNLVHEHAIAVRFEHLEIICAALNCTPNDLFDWKPDAKLNLAENHSLHTLKHVETTEKLSDMMKNLPIEKLSEIQNLIGELKNQ